MTAAAVQPKNRTSHDGSELLPIAEWLFRDETIIIMGSVIGTAATPLMTALQNSALGPDRCE